MEASLYIHVPFCAGAKCDYCDFYSVPVNSSNPWSANLNLPHYVDSVLSAGGRLFEKYSPSKIPTLYIGGGTPSVLGPAGIRKLLGGLLELIAKFSRSSPLEITVEANPESADEAFLTAARESGATRLSLGVQTFHDPSRNAVHRIGDAAMLHERLALAAGFFPDSFSVDLISGLPLQNEKAFLADIAAALSFAPAHISLYSLVVAPNTPLALAATKASRDKPFLPDRDEADRLWLAGRDALENAGYHQYEVSNFCLPGKESLHNTRYWHMRNWLALGPAASGTVIDDNTGRGRRFTFPPTHDNWFTPITEELSAITLMKETFLMGFRYVEGPDNYLFRRRFHYKIDDCIPKAVEKWRNSGLLRQDRIALTKKGLLLLDRFLIEVFAELDAFSLWC